MCEIPIIFLFVKRTLTVTCHCIVLMFTSGKTDSYHSNAWLLQHCLSHLSKPFEENYAKAQNIKTNQIHLNHSVFLRSAANRYVALVSVSNRSGLIRRNRRGLAKPPIECFGGLTREQSFFSPRNLVWNLCHAIAISEWLSILLDRKNVRQNKRRHFTEDISPPPIRCRKQSKIDKR